MEYTIIIWLFTRRKRNSGVQTIVDNDEMLRLNEKLIEEKSDHKY